MEKMNYFIFYREDDKFDDILSDKNMKKLFGFKLKWKHYLMVGSDKVNNELYSYILLKYGDDMKNMYDIFSDRTPRPFIDYNPDPKRPERFKKL